MLSILYLLSFSRKEARGTCWVKSKGPSHC